MSDNIIYKPYETITISLPTSSNIPVIKVKQDVNDISDIVYMREAQPLFDLNKNKNTNDFFKDLVNNFIDSEMEVATTAFLSEDSTRSLKKADTFFRDYAVQESGVYATSSFEKGVVNNKVLTNNIYTFNSLLLNNNIYDFLIEMTQPNNNYDSLIIRMPTIVSKAMKQYVYLITHLFMSVKLSKFKEGPLFKDTFIITANRMYNNIKQTRNTIGMALAKKHKQSAFTHELLNSPLITSVIDDPYSEEFDIKWTQFSNSVRNEVYRFIQTLRLSISTGNLLNPKQLFLKKIVTGVEHVAGGVFDNIHNGKNNYTSAKSNTYKIKQELSFSEYLKINHTTSSEEEIPITTDYKHLKTQSEYDPSLLKQMPSFSKRGQVKLLLVEIRYMLRILPRLRMPNPKLIIYIGAAPGLHLLRLMKMFHNPSMHWMLYDKAVFHPALEKVKEIYNITIVNSFFTQHDIKVIRSNWKEFEIHIISDIRYSSSDEPTTIDLIRDYTLENNTVIGLNPATALLKWRYPFVDQKSSAGLSQTFSFSRVVGEEWLQPFAKPDSSEMRLFVDGTTIEMREVTVSDMLLAERLLSGYKYIDRYKPRIIPSDVEQIITSCRCNDCAQINMLATECKNNGISFTAKDVDDMVVND